MADEVQEQSAEQTPGADDIESPDFNWASFFAEDDGADEAEEAPAPQAAAQAAPQAPVEREEEYEETESPDVAQLREQLADLQKIVMDTSKTTTEIATKNRVQAAVAAWKQQASPAELLMEDVLSEANSLEDLQTKAQLVKRVANSSEKLISEQRVKIEQELQRQFGLPITPTYQPIPEKEKMNEALAEGDLDKASALALKGFFHG